MFIYSRSSMQSTPTQHQEACGSIEDVTPQLDIGITAGVLNLPSRKNALSRFCAAGVRVLLGAFLGTVLLR
eukprot:1351030-Pleurochrysis_carterae.AAC.3